MNNQSLTQPLTQNELRELRFELQVERARLKRLASTQDTETTIHDAGSASHAAAHPTAVLTDTHARIDAIDAALERMENGTYGSCSECQQVIPYGRLLVMPEATHCVGCWPRA